MTAQAPDLLVIDGEEAPLFATPLDEYIGSLGKGWPFASALTSNWRGYIATWKIEDDALFLVALRGWVATKPINAAHPLDIRLGENLAALPPAEDPFERALNPPAVPLTFLFPEASDRVAATWFSGVLRVPRGKLLQYVHMGYESTYEEDLIITIERGRVTHREIVDRRAELAGHYATTLIGMASGRTPAPAGLDRQALRTAIAEFSNAASAEELRSREVSESLRNLLSLADQIGFSQLQLAIRATSQDRRSPEPA